MQSEDQSAAGRQPDAVRVLEPERFRRSRGPFTDLFSDPEAGKAAKNRTDYWNKRAEELTTERNAEEPDGLLNTLDNVAQAAHFVLTVLALLPVWSLLLLIQELKEVFQSDE